MCIVFVKYGKTVGCLNFTTFLTFGVHYVDGVVYVTANLKSCNANVIYCPRLPLLMQQYSVECSMAAAHLSDLTNNMSFAVKHILHYPALTELTSDPVLLVSHSNAATFCVTGYRSFGLCGQHNE